MERKHDHLPWYKLKRGMYSNLDKTKFVPHELFYITDLRMIGVADDNGVPQLLAEVEKYNYKNEFPEEGEAGKLYLDADSGKVYTYNGERYIDVILKHINGYKQLRVD